MSLYLAQGGANLTPRCIMLTLLIVSSAICTHASLHHLFVGTKDGQALYSLEMDTEARMVYMISARDASGPSPSLALDVCHLNLAFAETY